MTQPFPVRIVADRVHAVNPKREYSIRGGRLHEFYRAWWATGELAICCYFYEGELVGVFEYMSADRAVVVKAVYHEGLLNGICSITVGGCVWQAEYLKGKCVSGYPVAVIEPGGIYNAMRILRGFKG